MPRSSELDGAQTHASAELPTISSGPVEHAPAAEHRRRSFGRYLVLEEVGRGGMGIVFRAFDPVLRREVALKVIRGDGCDGIEQRRLLAEARAMARLTHPNVVAAYDAMVVGADVVLALEFIAGMTLGQWLRIGPRPWRELVEVFSQAGRGLAAGHRTGIVHRDFKPSNVLITGDGRVAVADFGIAVDVGGAGSSSGERGRSVGLETEAGIVVGTPKYMAPEQHRGRAVDARCDQYAFCVAFYEAVCGHAPFAGETLDALERAKRGPLPVWPQAVQVPRRVAAAIERGLAPDPDARWPLMEDLLAALCGRTSPSSLRFATATVVVAAGVAPIATALWSARAQRCSGAPAELEGVWDRERAAAVRSAVLATKASYARSTWTRLHERLGRYAGAWVRHHRAACEATVVDGRQSAAIMNLRMACLHRRKLALDSAVDVLLRADGQVVERAVALVASLPAIERCGDVVALSADVAPPTDPEVGAAVERARVGLARAAAQERAGRYRQALDELERASAAVAEVDYAPVTAELAFRRGSILKLRGDYTGARLALEHGLVAALGAGMDELAADALALLGSLLGRNLDHSSAGLSAARLGVELATERSPALEARARTAVGNVLHGQGRDVEAAAAYREALAALERTSDPPPLALASIANNLGTTLVRLGRITAGEQQLRRALRLRNEVFGPEHPMAAGVRSNLAELLFRRGRFDEAAAELEQVLAVWELAFGPEHPKVADIHANLAIVWGKAGRYDASERAARQALAAFVAAVGPKHVAVAEIELVLGDAQSAQGRRAVARTTYERALAVFEATAPDHPRRALPLERIADLLLRDGRDRQALPYLERAFAIRERGPRSPVPTAVPAFRLARLSLRLGGDRTRALRLARVAFELFERAGDERSATVADWLAQQTDR